MRLSALLAATALSLASPLMAQGVPSTELPTLTFEQVFASPSLDGTTPREMKLSPDGRWLTLLRNREEDKERYDLWGYDRQAGDLARFAPPIGC